MTCCFLQAGCHPAVAVGFGCLPSSRIINAHQQFLKRAACHTIAACIALLTVLTDLEISSQGKKVTLQFPASFPAKLLHSPLCNQPSQPSSPPQIHMALQRLHLQGTASQGKKCSTAQAAFNPAAQQTWNER
jgi:hypothetical protein